MTFNDIKFKLMQTYSFLKKLILSRKPELLIKNDIYNKELIQEIFKLI